MNPKTIRKKKQYLQISRTYNCYYIVSSLSEVVSNEACLHVNQEYFRIFILYKLHTFPNSFNPRRFYRNGGINHKKHTVNVLISTRYLHIVYKQIDCECVNLNKTYTHCIQTNRMWMCYFQRDLYTLYTTYSLLPFRIHKKCWIISNSVNKLFG